MTSLTRFVQSHRPAAAAAVVLLAAIVLHATGVAPWFLIVVDLVLVTLAIARRTSWILAFGSAVLLVLVLPAVVLRLTPWLGGPGWVEVWVTVVAGLLGAAAILPLAGAEPPRLPRRTTLLAALPALVFPVAAFVGFRILSASNNLGLSWSMKNDAAWNLLSARFVLSDGGLTGDTHPNPSPLTAALTALSIAPGRVLTAPGDLLAHDVTRTAELWLALALVSAVLAGLVAVRLTRSASAPVRWIAPVITGLVPLGWFSLGYAIFFGFLNETLAIVALLATWLVWMEARSAPVLATAALSLGTVVMLATWAPLAILPALFAAITFVSGVVGAIRSRSGGILWWILAAVPIPLYALTVTLADLRRSGEALSADGGIFALQISQVQLGLAVATAFGIAQAVRSRSRPDLVGWVVVATGSAVGVIVLMLQRAGEPSLWGYYPIKMAWIALSFVFVLLVAAVFAEVGAARGRPVQALLVGGTGLLVAGLLMLQNPPPFGPNRAYLFPLANILTGTGASSSDSAARELFDLARPDEKTMAVTDSAADDAFVNFWLLQLHVDGPQDSIRRIAYYLDSSDLAQVCEAVVVWRGDVVIHTSDGGLDGRLSAACPDGDFRVVVDD